MCLITLALNKSSTFRLAILANRDEFSDRATSAATFHDTSIYGTDLLKGGTWLGLNRNGKLAAVTNFRNPAKNSDSKRSRGFLVTDFLNNNLTLEEYAASVILQKEQFNPFNLLLFDQEEMLYLSNMGNGEPIKITEGFHSLSNSYLDSKWPKELKSRNRLKKALTERDDFEPADFLRIMLDKEKTADSLLPDTGVGVEWERKLSPVFIEDKDYRTRSTTLILIDHKNRVQFIEMTHEIKGNSKISCDERFSLYS